MIFPIRRLFNWHHIVTDKPPWYQSLNYLGDEDEVGDLEFNFLTSVSSSCVFDQWRDNGIPLRDWQMSVKQRCTAHRRQKWEQIIDAFLENCGWNGIETAWLWWGAHDNFSNLIFRTRPKIRKWRDGSGQNPWQRLTHRGATNRLDLIAEKLEESISCEDGRRWSTLVRVATQNLSHRFPQLEWRAVLARQSSWPVVVFLPEEVNVLLAHCLYPFHSIFRTHSSPVRPLESSAVASDGSAVGIEPRWQWSDFGTFRMFRNKSISDANKCRIDGEQFRWRRWWWGMGQLRRCAQCNSSEARAMILFLFSGFLESLNSNTHFINQHWKLHAWPCMLRSRDLKHDLSFLWFQWR